MTKLSTIDRVEQTESTLVSRNITVSGRRTTVRLGDEMWGAMKEVSVLEGCSVDGLCTRIHGQRQKYQSLTSAIRVFLMLYYRDIAQNRTSEEGGYVGQPGSFPLEE